MSELSPVARAVVAAVIAAGAATCAESLVGTPTWTATEWAAVTGLAAAVVVTERFQLELSYRRERVTYSVSDAVWAGALLVAPSDVLVVAVVAGVVVGQSAQSWAGVKVAFNASQFALGILAAATVFDALDPPAATAPAAWLAAAAAMAAFQAVNTFLMAAIITITERASFWRVALVPTGVLHWMGNLALGITGAIVWTVEPLGLPLSVVPLALTYLAYRGNLEIVGERDQLRAIAYAAEDITGGADFGRRVPDHGQTPAVAVLATTINHMLDRVDEAFRRERQFISETSHELRTPITICRGHLEVLGPNPSAGEVADTTAVVTDELDRMARLVADMATLARMEDPASLHVDEVDLERLISDVAAKALPLVNGRLRVDATSGGRLSADAQRLTQALLNLVHNAAQHTTDGTDIHLAADQRAASCRFEVADHGGGLAPGTEAQVFQPFYTGKQCGGSGLGLAIVAGIARAHGGDSGVINRPGDGATFWLEVPV